MFKCVYILAVICILFSVCGCELIEPDVNNVIVSNDESNNPVSFIVQRPASYRKSENSNEQTKVYHVDCCGLDEISIYETDKIFNAYYTIDSDGTISKCDDSLTVNELRNKYNNIYTAEAIGYIINSQKRDSKLISIIDNNI